MLVRHYLNKLLYDSSKGYFCTLETKPIIENDEFFNFSKMNNAKEWYEVQQTKFNQASGQWFTQCELFAPYFSSVLLDFIIKEHYSSFQSQTPNLNIIEIGAGSGTNALNLLDMLKLRYPAIYKRTSYLICEISPILAQRQLQKISGRHGNKVVKVTNVDFLKWNERKRCEEPYMILGMEVLDNLPHDKLTYKESEILPSEFAGPKGWEEVLVQDWGVESSRQLMDPIAMEAAQYFIKNNENYFSGNTWSQKTLLGKVKKYITMRTRYKAEAKAKSIFVPSGAIELLHVLNENFPFHSVLLGDFSFLPFGDVAKTKLNMHIPGSLFGCKNSPIVSGIDPITKKRVDYASYIAPPSSNNNEALVFDVFFQTNFQALAAAYSNRVSNGTAQIFSSNQFLEQYIRNEDRAKTTTKSGFNPLLEDFENISFLFGRRGM
jgi:hypothetical protein